MRKDTTKHPFELRFNAMLRSAKAFEKTRADKPRPRDVPTHIQLRLDEEQNRWGMYNYRLDQWVKEEYQEDHSTFRNPDAAIEWYRDLI